MREKPSHISDDKSKKKSKFRDIKVKGNLRIQIKNSAQQPFKNMWTNSANVEWKAIGLAPLEEEKLQVKVVKAPVEESKYTPDDASREINNYFE